VLRELAPEKRMYNVSQSIMTEAAIDTGITGDLYVALGERLPDGRWTVRAWVKPFVNWIWGGCFLMALGGFVAIADRRYRSARASAPAPAARSAGAPA
jgi:cytochrome c-type biogenesis protein CcmF